MPYDNSSIKILDKKAENLGNHGGHLTYFAYV